jgi:hypothetical protein
LTRRIIKAKVSNRPRTNAKAISQQVTLFITVLLSRAGKGCEGLFFALTPDQYEGDQPSDRRTPYECGQVPQPLDDEVHLEFSLADCDNDATVLGAPCRRVIGGDGVG